MAKIRDHRNGRIGKLQRIEVILPKQPGKPGDPTAQPVPEHLDYEMWLGPAPQAPFTKDRVHYNYRWIEDYSGGIICDWGTHLFDTAQWANDTEHSGPVEVEGTGNYWSGGLFNTVKDYDVTFRYENGVVMTCKPGTPSIRFVGSDGWVGNTGWRAPLQASSDEILSHEAFDQRRALACRAAMMGRRACQAACKCGLLSRQRSWKMFSAPVSPQNMPGCDAR